MTRQEIFNVVEKNIKEIVEKTRNLEIKEEDSMENYGADSLEMVEVVSRSLKQLKIKVPRTELSKAENIGGLIDLFEKYQK